MQLPVPARGSWSRARFPCPTSRWCSQGRRRTRTARAVPRCAGRAAARAPTSCPPSHPTSRPSSRRPCIQPCIRRALDQRVELAALPRAEDGVEQLPDVLLGLVVLAAVGAALWLHALHEAPLDELLQRGRDAAARDREALHDVLGRQGLAGDEEQCVHLRHRSLHAPAGAHLAPEGDEAVLRRADGVGLGQVAARGEGAGRLLRHGAHRRTVPFGGTAVHRTFRNF